MKHLIPYILFLIFLCTVSLFASQRVKEAFVAVSIPEPRQSADPGFGTGELTIRTELTDGDPCTAHIQKLLEATKKARGQWNTILGSTNASILSQYPQESRRVMVQTAHDEGTRILLEMAALQKKHPLTEDCRTQFPREEADIANTVDEITKSLTLLKGVLG